jgi:hypothetical protein
MTFFVKMIVMLSLSLPDCPLNRLKAVIQFCFLKNCQITQKSYSEIWFFIAKICANALKIKGFLFFLKIV